MALSNKQKEMLLLISKNDKVVNFPTFQGNR